MATKVLYNEQSSSNKQKYFHFKNKVQEIKMKFNPFQIFETIFFSNYICETNLYI